MAAQDNSTIKPNYKNIAIVIYLLCFIYLTTQQSHYMYKLRKLEERLATDVGTEKVQERQINEMPSMGYDERRQDIRKKRSLAKEETDLETRKQAKLRFKRHEPYSQVGAVYIRWGRTICNGTGGTDLVYEGVAGGSFYSHTGAASNVLCLPRVPVWGRYSDAAQGFAFVYGAEYEDSATDLYSKENAERFGNHNVPCAVCRTRRRCSVLMIPAKTVCPQDWVVEYKGYLMTNGHGQKGQTEYTCIDEAPEADPAGYVNENGVLFYRTESMCGSLPCPHYVNNRDLACVVCSK